MINWLRLRLLLMALHKKSAPSAHNVYRILLDIDKEPL
jgi:hypothetical protein